MKIRADIAELLHAGVPQIQISRQLRCAPLTVQRTREALGLPAPKSGRPSFVSFEDAFRAHTEPTDDGHVRWTGPVHGDDTPTVYAQRGQRSAYRVAFTLHHGREPIGRVTPGCRLQGCVRGDHLEDQPMRERTRQTYAAIFGGGS
jgi:hypothetical protein